MHRRTATVVFVSHGRRFYSSGNRFQPVQILRDAERNGLNKFEHGQPLILPKAFAYTPAITSWFAAGSDGYHDLNMSFIERYGSVPVPLELTRLPSTSTEQPTFEQLQAPLALLFAHMADFQVTPIRLYLAQCPLDDLPPELRAELPQPTMIQGFGKGDVYGSSLWMGKPPTRTPLHRDPNPNLFVQLAGKKTVRLMKPEAGKDLYMRMRGESGHANLRGEEMMVGGEHERLEEAVWKDEGTAENEVAGWEAQLGSGDGLYIPLGWWHAVRGTGRGVNASVSRCSRCSRASRARPCACSLLLTTTSRSTGGSDEPQCSASRSSRIQSIRVSMLQRAFPHSTKLEAVLDGPSPPLLLPIAIHGMATQVLHVHWLKQGGARHGVRSTV